MISYSLYNTYTDELERKFNDDIKQALIELSEKF